MASHRAGFAALAVGTKATFSKTVSESGVYLFAGLTGDLSPNHVRFPARLFLGGTVTVTYEVVERDEAAGKAFSRVTCTTQRGDVVAVD